ncbi:helix-turn-helix transcriptional regulator [Roseomonas mucosa]|uniref:helix-turn-helix transcriptional regulator n=1 Tax=Roseomonas mucosa TaxID=207340 RepID=UPI003392F9D8
MLISPLEDPLLSPPKLAERLGISLPTVWRITAEGRIPRPVYLAPRMPRWRLSEVMAALETTRALPAEARAARRRRRAAQAGAAG